MPSNLQTPTPFAAAIKFGIPLLHVWMQVVGLLENAAANCQDTSGSNWGSIVDWDKVSGNSQNDLLLELGLLTMLSFYIHFRPWPYTLDPNREREELADTLFTR